MSGEHVYLRSEEEKEVVLREASERAARLAKKKSEEKGEAVEAVEPEFEGVGEEAKKVFSERVLEGRYEPLVDGSRKGVARDIVRMLRMNGSYRLGDEQALMRKAGPLLPVPQRR